MLFFLTSVNSSLLCYTQFRLSQHPYTPSYHLTSIVVGITGSFVKLVLKVFGFEDYVAWGRQDGQDGAVQVGNPDLLLEDPLQMNNKIWWEEKYL